MPVKSNVRWPLKPHPEGSFTWDEAWLCDGASHVKVTIAGKNQWGKGGIYTVHKPIGCDEYTCNRWMEVKATK